MDFENFKDNLDSVKEIPENIEEICDLYDCKYKLWSTKLAFEEMENSLAPMDLASFEKIKKQQVEKVEKMLQDVMKVKGILPDNNLCASETYEELKKFRELIIAISKIQTPYYEERRKIKKSVNETLGFNFY